MCGEGGGGERERESGDIFPAKLRGHLNEKKIIKAFKPLDRGTQVGRGGRAGGGIDVLRDGWCYGESSPSTVKSILRCIMCLQFYSL